MVACASIGVHRGEREHRFMKDDITRNIDPTGGDIQTFGSLMHVVISKENTTSGANL
jgi:hypothetical protein